MIEDFAVIRAFAHLATAHPVSPDRVALLDPVDDVKVVDVLLDDVVAANPGEVIPVAHLIFHFGKLAPGIPFQVGASVKPWSLAVPVTAHRDDVADRAVMKALDAFDIAGAMMALQSDAYF